MSSKSDNKGRTRNWTFILYPDSAPENWQYIISSFHIAWASSPLHDSDLNGDGSEKKPHWHVLLAYDGVKTYEQVLAITQMCNGTIPNKVHSTKALIRYFAHLDNPDKHQYTTSDIQCFNGFDISIYLKPTSSERYIIIREILQFIDDNYIIEYQDLINYAMKEHFDDWFPVLCDNSSYICCQYIKSQRHRVVDRRS
ncbi:MAG: replication protein [Clostridiales bacterium]|nr:replication protein [Clostridiales bacterium]